VVAAELVVCVGVKMCVTAGAFTVSLAGIQEVALATT
jgi:hypothetical protein